MFDVLVLLFVEDLGLLPYLLGFVVFVLLAIAGLLGGLSRTSRVSKGDRVPAAQFALMVEKARNS